ncbi:hypothetical protein V9T40_012089 [Parthenolecanium corni]|uniref:Uncharacterized protein n=1 Tax=Parthenolecanium corni TaxID=536013 RepID=A0AAN9T6M2_9HEMI
MAAGSSKCGLLDNELLTEFDDLTDFDKTCTFVGQEGDHHQKLREAVQSLATEVEGMNGYESPQPHKIAEIYANIEKILTLLVAKKPPSQSPLLDQLLDELQKLKTLNPPSLPPFNEWNRLDRIEENLVHVIANVGYDILNAVSDVRSKIGTPKTQQSTSSEQPAFAVDSKYSRQQSIAKYMHILQHQVSHKGEFQCSPHLESSDLKEPTQKEGLLDRQIHIASPVHLYELCPIEVEFKSFNSADNIRVIINFAAAASYINFTSSICTPNCSGPIPVQIPWMSNLQNINVLGKVAVEILFSEICNPITFQMNVVDCSDQMVIIFGRDFLDKYVHSVHHDRKVVIMHDSVEPEKVFEKQFVYLARVLKEIETTFCRYRLKNEERDADDILAKINRLQRVFDQQLAKTSNQSQTSEKQTIDPKSSTDEQNAEILDLKLNSEPQEKYVYKSCSEVKDVADFSPSSQPENVQQVSSQSSSLNKVVKENLDSIVEIPAGSSVEQKKDSKPSSQLKIETKKVASFTQKTVKNENPKPSSQPKTVEKAASSSAMSKEDGLKSNSQPKVMEKVISAPSNSQTAESEVVKTTVEPQNLTDLKNIEEKDLMKSSHSKNVKEILVLKTASIFKEKEKLPFRNVEKISNLSLPSTSSQFKNIEDFTPCVRLKRVDDEKKERTVKSEKPEQKQQDSEKKLLEMKSQPDQQVESENLQQTEDTKKTAVGSANIQSQAYQKKKSKLGQREPSYFHHQIVPKEMNLDRFKAENAGKNVLDPTRPRPPVIKKVETPQRMEVDSIFQSDKNKTDKYFLPAGNAEEKEIIFRSGNEDVKGKTLTVMVSQPADPSGLCQRRVIVKGEEEPPLDLEKKEKKELVLITLPQNMEPKKADSKFLVPTSVIKNQAQESQIAKSCTEEPVMKPKNVETTECQDMD